MDLARIPAGRAPPYDLNLVIEIPQGSQVQYALDPASGAAVVSRVLPLPYPVAQGFVPGTLSPDGMPVTALVLLAAPVVPGCVLRARPIGLVRLEGESGGEERLLCVPHDEIQPIYAGVASPQELPAITRAAIEHFFAGSGFRTRSWGSADEAAAVIRHAIAAGRNSFPTAAE